MMARTKAATVTDPWQRDLLERQAEAGVLYRFLTSRVEDRRRAGQPGTYVLNIDAAWGQGKSFFLKAWRDELTAQGHRVAYVDAWADDYAQDPFLAVVSALSKVLPAKGKGKTVMKATGQLALMMAKQGAKTLVKKVAGEDGAALAELVGEDLAKGGVKALNETVDKASDALGRKLAKAFDEVKQTIETFKTDLAAAATENGARTDPIFVLIDELDRCRPTYAIELLERVKHLFEVDGVVFVIATDTTQLQHAIRAVYGAGFAADRYLHRFIDRTYSFQVPDPENFLAYLLERSGLDLAKFRAPLDLDRLEILSAAVTASGISLRDTERLVDVLQTVAGQWTHAWPIDLVYVTALATTFVKQEMELFQSLIASTKIESTRVFDDKGYRIAFNVDTDTPFAPPKRDSVTLAEYLMRYSESLCKPLPDSVAIDARNAVARHIRNMFQSEYAASHGSAYRGNAKPVSKALDLASLVKLGGRFLEKENPGDRPKSEERAS